MKKASASADDFEVGAENVMRPEATATRGFRLLIKVLFHLA